MELLHVVGLFSNIVRTDTTAMHSRESERHLLGFSADFVLMVLTVFRAPTHVNGYMYEEPNSEWQLPQ